MSQHRLVKTRLMTRPSKLAAALVFALLLSIPRPASAVPAETQKGPSTPCAVLESFGGEVQVLDASRTYLVDAVAKAPISCGGWVSVGNGWAVIRHREGFRVHVAPNSFVETPEYSRDGKAQGDHFVLYKGQVFGEAEPGTGELRVLTANARSRTRRGSMLMIYDAEGEETQLISLTHSSSLENRFEPSRRITAKAGEATSLSLREMRVVPTIPKATTVASLKTKLPAFHLSDSHIDSFLMAAHDRQTRKFPDLPGQEDSETGAKRTLASAPEMRSDYSRHHPAPKIDAALHERMIRKIAGGDSAAQTILFPDKFYGRPQTVHLDVRDVEAAESKFKQKRHHEEDAEKKRLIEELSQIRAD